MEVKKKDGESFESLLRRFNRKIQQSGILVRVRRTQYQLPKKSRNMGRVSARRRSELREEREELKKLGRPVPYKFGRRSR